MPDPDSSPPAPAVQRASGYPNAAQPATSSLAGKICEMIALQGSLSFSDFMAAALYDPELGYYARGTRQVGRTGDFYTSVSVGPLFGELLARRFLREWKETGHPSHWRIVEFGAHDGTLASDILHALRRLDDDAFNAVEYVICEPLPLLQSAQQETLKGFEKQTRFICDTQEIGSAPLPGIIFGNELLDALPFHVIEFRNGAWHECRVTNGPDGEFQWDSSSRVENGPLAEALRPLGLDFHDGYRTEVRTGLTTFLDSISPLLSSGLWIWPDYGFARPDYYEPARTTGTLRTFSRHRAAEDPLINPGELDITAHVDFTAVAEAARSLGAEPVSFLSQGTWITEAAREWLLAMEGNPDLTALRQFQTLTHPAHLGKSFHVLEIAWNRPQLTLPETDQRRLAL